MAVVFLPRRVVFGVVAAGLSLVAAELGLQLASYFIPFVRYQLAPPWSRGIVPDSTLGYRLSPFEPGHDRRGFRNHGAEAQYDVIAVGDSMTYGYAASVDGAWPAQFQRVSGLSVYNAGVGGYGPCEYPAVVEELLALRPQIVVLALYAGNDLADAYRSVYVQNRCPHFRSDDRRVLDAMARADEAGTLAERTRPFEEATRVVEPGPLKRLALYGLFRAVAHRVNGGGQASTARGPGDTYEAAAAKRGRIAMDGPSPFRTVFLDPRLYEFSTDLEDPRIAEGLRITLAAVERIRARLPDGVTLQVMVLHNKPAGLAEVLQSERPDLWPRLQRLVALEDEVTRVLMTTLGPRGAVIDTLGAVRSALAQRRMLYPSTDDHHYNEAGYGVIAAALHREIAVR